MIIVLAGGVWEEGVVTASATVTAAGGGGTDVIVSMRGTGTVTNLIGLGGVILVGKGTSMRIPIGGERR